MMKRERTVILLYFVILLTAIAGMKTVINEFKAETKKLQSEKSQLNKELEQSNREKEELNKKIIEYQTESKELKEKINKLQSTSRGTSRNRAKNLGEFVVTCYDLSVQSCGKEVGSKGYGMTASGVSLVGHTWKTARAIAVDPKVIPLGSKVELIFTNEKYSKYNGIYHCIDTGGAIKGKRIDFFLGDFNQNKTHQDVWDFGKTKAVVRVLEQGR